MWMLDLSALCLGINGCVRNVDKLTLRLFTLLDLFGVTFKWNWTVILCPAFVQFLFEFHYLLDFLKALRCFHFDPQKHTHTRMHFVRWQIEWIHRVQHAFFTIVAIFRYFLLCVCDVCCQATCLFCARCYFFLTISFRLHVRQSAFVSFRFVGNVTLNYICMYARLIVCLCIYMNRIVYGSI